MESRVSPQATRADKKRRTGTSAQRLSTGRDLTWVAALYIVPAKCSYIDSMEKYAMHAVQVRELKNNPSQALRIAEQDMVVVMNRDHPSALLFHFDEAMLKKAGVSVALATALFRDGSLSLARAAKVAGMPLVEFMQHLSRLGIAIVQGTEEDAGKDMETLEVWLKSS